MFNSKLWDNDSLLDQGEAIAIPRGTPVLNLGHTMIPDTGGTIVQNVAPASGTINVQEGNLTIASGLTAPGFVSEGAEDFHLLSSSTAIDAGDDNLLAADVADLNGNLDTEPLPYDKDNEPRIWDAPGGIELTDPLVQGPSYFLYTSTAGNPTVGYTATFTDAGSPFPIPLVGISSGRFNFIGDPFNQTVAWDSVQVEVDTARGTTIYPSITDAAAAGVVSPLLYSWNGAAWQTAIARHPVRGLAGQLDVMGGSMVLAYEDAALLVSSPSRRSAPAPMEPGPDDWWVQLAVESENLKDPGNYLGQLAVSQDGVDEWDLPEMAPFGARSLSVVFKLPDSGGNWTADFRSSVPGVAHEWPFEVQARGVDGVVTLRWEGPAEVLKRSEIVDLQTGERIEPAIHDDYEFIPVGASRNFLWRTEADATQVPTGLAWPLLMAMMTLLALAISRRRSPQISSNSDH